MACFVVCFCTLFQRCLVRLGLVFLLAGAVSDHTCSTLDVISTCSFTQTCPLHTARLLSSVPVIRGFSPKPFLNMRSSLYFCSCGLEKRHQRRTKYCSNSKFTSGQIQWNTPDVFLPHPFHRGCIGGDLC